MTRTKTITVDGVYWVAGRNGAVQLTAPVEIPAEFKPGSKVYFYEPTSRFARFNTNRPRKPKVGRIKHASLYNANQKLAGYIVEMHIIGTNHWGAVPAAEVFATKEACQRALNKEYVRQLKNTKKLLEKEILTKQSRLDTVIVKINEWE